MKVIKLKDVEIYTDESGYAPFVEWLESLKDKTIRFRVKERLYRVMLGNLGDHKTLGEGISELRLKFGSGYRIYYGEWKGKVVLLLCAGDKASQSKDIKKAKKYWQNFLTR